MTDLADFVFPELETARYRLRELRDSDADVLFGYFSDPELVRHFGIEPFTSVEQARHVIEHYRTAVRGNEGIRWGVERRDTGELVGSCGYHAWVKLHRRAEVGYEVKRALWRTGVMSEVLPAVLRYGFERMELNRIAALVSPQNTASARLAQKLGFHREGVLRQYEQTAGRFDDLVSFSLLRHELLSG